MPPGRHVTLAAVAQTSVLVFSSRTRLIGQVLLRSSIQPSDRAQAQIPAVRGAQRAPHRHRCRLQDSPSDRPASQGAAGTLHRLPSESLTCGPRRCNVSSVPSCARAGGLTNARCGVTLCTLLDSGRKPRKSDSHRPTASQQLPSLRGMHSQLRHSRSVMPLSHDC